MRPELRQCGKLVNPFCSPAGTCVACANDFECQARPGVQDTCVNGQCRRCDHESGDNRGCDETSTEISAAYSMAHPDAQAASMGRLHPFLCDEVDGRCAACQPKVPGLAGQRGCGVASIAPICDRNSDPADRARPANVTLVIFNTVSTECV